MQEKWLGLDKEKSLPYTWQKGTNVYAGTCDVFSGTIGSGISAGVDPSSNQPTEWRTHVTEGAETRHRKNE